MVAYLITYRSNRCCLVWRSTFLRFSDEEHWFFRQLLIVAVLVHAFNQTLINRLDICFLLEERKLLDCGVPGA